MRAPNHQPWSPGDVVVRRELLHGQPWIGFATRVVQDTDDLLVVHLAEGSEQAVSIRTAGGEIAAMLAQGSHWWDSSWADWEPPAAWSSLTVPPGWAEL